MAEKNTTALTAEEIIANAKKEAEKIIASAKETATSGEIVSRSVSKEDIIEAYNSGLSHLEVAKKFYGNTNDDNMQKVIAVIEEAVPSGDDKDPEVEVTDPWIGAQQIMDWTREGDLTRLHKVFNDPLKSRHERRLAHDTFNKILRQLKDKKLTELRRRLIRANIADDDAAVERITEEIHEYSRRAGYRQRLQHKQIRPFR